MYIESAPAVPHGLPEKWSILGVAPNSFGPNSDSHNTSSHLMGLAKKSSRLAIVEPVENTNNRVLDYLPESINTLQQMIALTAA